MSMIDLILMILDIVIKFSSAVTGIYKIYTMLQEIWNKIKKKKNRR